MIGNDVVDIVQSRQESNWQRKGFLEKLFTTQEQSFISINSEPEITVWLLWSMKEAAYKIYNRETKIREYCPKKFICTIILQSSNYCTGQVIYADKIYYTKTTIIQNVIHTIAVCNLHDLDNVMEIENKAIVKDKYGIPYLQTHTKSVLNDVSVSHHGQYEKVVTITPRSRKNAE